jgi:hypothetical protein
VAEVEKRRFQLGKGFAKAFEPTAPRATLRRRERALEWRVCIDVARPGIGIAHQESTQPRLEADCQPNAVLIVEHLVCVRCAEPHAPHGEEHHNGLAPKHPQHAGRLPNLIIALRDLDL